MQTTLAKPTTVKGVGLHSGQEITLTLSPAPENSGITFIRTDLEDGKNAIPALWDKVVDTKLCTVISNDHGASVGTIEHIMSALCACKIDNITLHINGAEAPIMDGSAQVFIDAIEQVGIKTLDAPRKSIRILKEVRVEKDGKNVILSPADDTLYEGTISFDHPSIGTQDFAISLENGNFNKDIASARTFGFAHEVEYLRANGLARGGSLKNAIVLDQEKVLNPEGLRFENEFIRHKLLDAVGDLYLAGHQIQGAYKGYKAGHEMNNLILHELFKDNSAWEYV